MRFLTVAKIAHSFKSGQYGFDFYCKYRKQLGLINTLNRFKTVQNPALVFILPTAMDLPGTAPFF
jgi:hypothetical protein